MPYISFTRSFTFDAAHSLVESGTQCDHVHGHTYHLDVTFIQAAGDVEDGGGIVVEGSEAKRRVRDLIVNDLDHAFIAQGDEPILGALREHGYDVHLLGSPTTVENIARYIYDLIFQAPGLPVYKVELWETPKQKATVRANSEVMRGKAKSPREAEIGNGRRTHHESETQVE